MATTDLHKIPPHDLEAEESVLGALLLDKDAIIQVADFLRPAHFYTPTHQAIYEAMLVLFEQREPIDLITLTNQLKKKKALTKIGGGAYLSSLVNKVPTAAHAKHYSRIVKNLFTKREIISLSAELTQHGFDPSYEATALLETAEQRVFQLSRHHVQPNFVSMKEVLVESFDRLEEMQKNQDGIRGIPTGFADLDNMLSGLQDSNLIILAARPGMGKSAMALNITQNAAVLYKRKVGYFSLEMSKEELVDRLLVAQADIDAWRLKTARLGEEEYAKLSHAMGILAEAQIFIDDTPGLSMTELRTKARRLMLENDVDMFVVDYLQLVQGYNKENRVQEVGEISQGLKNLARELHVPVLALAQLSRAVESRGTKEPQLSDLRESGCLAGDTLIYLPDLGKYLPMRSLVGNSKFNILGLNPQTYKLERAEVSKAFSTGTKPVFKLKTRLGREIRATANHRFYTFRGWKRLDELNPGDRIGLPRSLGQPLHQTLSEAEVALLGHLIGDGCTLPSHVIQYTTKERELAEIVAEKARVIFGQTISLRIKKEPGHNWYQLFLTSTEHVTHRKENPVAHWLKNLGVFGLRSHEKHVPMEVFAQPKTIIAGFLRHLWATDGCMKMPPQRRGYPAVYYATSSKELALDVQTLLLHLGITARLTTVVQGTKGRDQYHVIVTGLSDLQIFVSEIGAVGKSRQARMAAIQNYLQNKKENTNRDVIPAEIWREIVVPAMQFQGVTSRGLQAGLGMSYAGTGLYKQNVSRARALRIAGVIKSPQIESLAQSDIYWDSIVSLTEDGVTDVYDLTVPGISNFVANNIIVHNSIEQDSDVVMFLYRPDEDIREQVKLKIAKHRNGSVGQLDLYFRGDRIRFYGMENRA